MQIAKLYKALVLGGAMLVAGCSTSKPAEPQPSKSPKPQPPKVNCAELCDGTGRDAFCKHPTTGVRNCCWLAMPGWHPCCPSRGSAPSP